MAVTPDCLSAEDSDDVSITNSEVESAMNHRHRRAALHDPGFTKEAFNASARLMHTSELLKMDLPEPQSNI